MPAYDVKTPPFKIDVSIDAQQRLNSSNAVLFTKIVSRRGVEDAEKIYQ